MEFMDYSLDSLPKFSPPCALFPFPPLSTLVEHSLHQHDEDQVAGVTLPLGFSYEFRYSA